MDNSIKKALKTWYPKDHLLHLEMRHPAIKLAGEAGELLDLYGKEEYKPGFSWWSCKLCKELKESHIEQDYFCPRRYEDEEKILYFLKEINPDKLQYTPLVLDELGDFTYYLRIIYYISNIAMNQIQPGWYYKSCEIEQLLILLARHSFAILDNYKSGTVDIYRLEAITQCLLAIFEKLNTSWDEVIELNWQKLNTPDQHGWKDA